SADHLQQRPRRPGGGGEGARPRDDGAAVRDPELLRPDRPHRLLEPLRAPRPLPALRHRVPDRVVVGRREGRSDRRRTVSSAGGRGLTRRGALTLAGAAAATAAMTPWAWAAGRSGLHGL